MSIALDRRVSALESRIQSLEEALNLLLRAQNASQQPSLQDEIEQLPIMVKIRNEIQGLKMRMGKQQ